jgi:hypothetical protein
MNRAATLIAQFLGWPAAAGLVWFWLSLPEGKVWQVGLSALLALVILIAVAALIAGALGRWTALFRVLPWLVIAAGISGFMLWRGASPAAAAIPWLLALPGFYQAVGGPSYLNLLSKFSTYAGIVVWAGLALAVPAKLIFWIPDVGPSFEAQAASAAARFVLAALLFILAWLALGSYWRKSCPA